MKLSSHRGQARRWMVVQSVGRKTGTHIVSSPYCHSNPYNFTRFELVISQSIIFDDIDTMSEVVVMKARNSSFRFNNIASVVLLRCLDRPNHYIWVVNGHLFWDPGHPTAKLLQAYYLLRKLQAFSTGFKKSNPQVRQSNQTNLWSQDFNSTISGHCVACNQWRL